MSRDRLIRPTTQMAGEAPIRKDRTQFNGEVNGIPASELADNESAKLVNLYAKGNHCEVRKGISQYYTSKFEMDFTIDINTSTSLLTQSVVGPIPYFSGGYLVYMTATVYPTCTPAFVYPTNQEWFLKTHGFAGGFKCELNAVADATRTGKETRNATTVMRWASNGSGIKLGLGIILAQIDTDYGVFYCIGHSNHSRCRLYYSGSKTLNSVYMVSPRIFGAGTSMSQCCFIKESATSLIFMVSGDPAAAAKDTNETGAFRIEISKNPINTYKVNHALYSSYWQAAGSTPFFPDVAETATKIYGYRYGISLVKMTGYGNRLTQGCVLDWESPIYQAHKSNVDKDFAEVYFDTPISNDPASIHGIGDFSLPSPCSDVTHYGLWRSKNIGANSGGASASIDGIGNRKDLLAWVDDIPICRPLTVTLSGAAGDTVTLGPLSKPFTANDVYGTLSILTALATVQSLPITGRTSDTVFSINNGGTVANGTYAAVLSSSSAQGICAFGIASQLATQTTLGLTSVDITPEAYTDTPTLFFTEDGSVFYVEKRNSRGPVVWQTRESLTFTSRTIAWIGPYGVSSYNVGMRSWNDTLKDEAQAVGEIGLQDRINSGLDYYLPRRFFTSIPDCNTGVYGNGFLVAGKRDTSIVYISQAGDRPHAIGYYRNPTQLKTLSSTIRMIWMFPSVAVIFCVDRTYSLPLSTGTNIGNSEIGENVVLLGDAAEISNTVGVYHWRTIVQKKSGLILAVTNEPAVRYFDGASWGENLAVNQRSGSNLVQKMLDRINSGIPASAAYCIDGGYKIWFFESNNLKVLRYATERAEGIGWCELTYSRYPGYWSPPFLIYDANKVVRQVFLETTNSTFVELDTFSKLLSTDKPPATDLGTEISWEEWGPEFTVSEENEHYKMEHDETIVALRPTDPANRGATGYDANGLRTGTTINVEDYIDGEKTTPLGLTTLVPQNGEAVFSGVKVEGRRHQIVVKGTGAELYLTSIVNKFIAKFKRGSRDERSMTERTYQNTLATGLEVHMSRGPTPVGGNGYSDATYDRVSKTYLPYTYTAYVPKYRSSTDKKLIDYDGTISLYTPDVGSNCTVLLWSSSANPILTIAMTQYGTATLFGNSYRLLYWIATAIAVPPVLTLSGPNQVGDVRVYSKALTLLQIASYYKDTAVNNGKAYWPSCL